MAHYILSLSNQMTMNYLKQILCSKVYDVVEESPLELANLLSQKLHNRILLKREDLQSIFSFKIRGAYNKMAHLSSEALNQGVIAASAGNHAQGVALSAQKLGCKAIIVMPTTTPQLKIDGVKKFGAEVVLHGDSYSDAYQHAKILEEKHHLTFVHPFDDPLVIAGQGTVGMELLRQHTAPIHAVFVSIGGGGLISGVAAYIKSLRPEIKIIGVQTHDSDAMVQSVEAQTIVELNDVGLFADGTAVKVPGTETFRLVNEYVDDFVRVSTDEICSSIQDIFQTSRSIVEPSGALALAGLKQYIRQHNLHNETLIAITSGANMNFDRLRFVAERAAVGEKREALFAIGMPEERGSFRKFCQMIGNRNVTEFNYRMSNTNLAQMFVGIQIQNAAEIQALKDQFNSIGFNALDLTDNELAKSHIRHMVGGRNSEIKFERLFRFIFPEKTGALGKFLDAMAPEWNISLFHYRNHGSDYGDILVGIQAEPQEKDRLDQFLQTTGYRYWDETDNPIYDIFLK